MQTFRRLNDPERYYGLSWRGWLAAAAAAGVLYAAVRFSPLAVKPTISVTVIALALAGSVVYGLSGQALGPGRFLLAAVRHATARKQLTLPEAPDHHGLIVSQPPPATEPDGVEVDVELEEAFR